MTWFANALLDLMASRRVAMLFLACAVLFVVFMRYGGGERMPNVDAPFTPFGLPPQLVAQSEVPISRIVLTANNVVYGVVHPRFQRPDLKVVRIDQDGQVTAFPNEDWQRGVFTRPRALTTDARGWLWVVEDHAWGQQRPQVLAIDPSTERLMLRTRLDRNSVPRGSSLSDVRVSADGMQLVMADSSAIALASRLVHLDLAAGTVTPKLVRDSAVRAARYRAVVGGAPFSTPLALRVHREGVNAVAFSADGRVLVFASAANQGLFALDTATALATGEDTETARRSGIRKLGDKPWTEDIAVDNVGNVYMTDVQRGRVLRLSPSGNLTAVVPANSFVWPSGLAFGPDGGLYVSETALNQPRWRFVLADVLDAAPFGVGDALAEFVRGNARAMHSLGIWRIDVGIGGVLG